MTEHARAVIVGGGVGGTSIAYHLAERGWTDILLVDRAELTSGSTFHSAGLVGQLRSTVTLTRMMMYGVELYRRLNAETGVDVSWHEVGSLRLASSKERYEELQRQAGWAKTFGLPLELISAGEARERFPLMSTDGVLGAVWLPTDGWLDPSGLAFALAAGARSRGATLAQHTRVVAIDVRDGRVRGVEVQQRGERRTIETEVVVDAGGMFAPEIARLAGVTVPIVPMAHEYLFTEPLEDVTSDLPTMRDPDNLCYFREEVGGLCMGGYERDPLPFGLDGIPPDFNHRLLDPDWPRFEPIMAGAIRRVPRIADAGVSRMINGPEAFTPDNEFILGESEVRGFFVAAGFCAHGIAGAGGIGRQVASWIVDGEPELDLWKMDIRQFGAQYRSRGFTLARTREVYATYYDIHYPNEERQSGRPLKTSPTYARLAALGASFGEKGGWERVNWCVSNEDPALEPLRPRGWAGQHWSTAIAAESLATRRSAGLFDETSFAKLDVSGSGAQGFLQRLCANDVDVPLGTIVYTSLLNRRGGIEADVTVTRLTADRYRIVTGTAFGQHDLGWLRTHDPRDGTVRIADETSAWVCFGVWGPHARSLLEPLTHDDLSADGFPYLTARAITLGSVPVTAFRVTYVGELGWELYAPTEYGATLWDTLVEAGAPHGLVCAGYRAIDSLRIEKGYRVWSGDITPDETPYEAGLGFAVKLDKGDFIGRDALRRARDAGPRKRLRCLVLDDFRSVCLGNEPVRIGGEVVGRVTSGGQGFAVERSIAYAFLPPDVPIGTTGEVDVFGEWVGFEVAREPLFDPAGERIRGVTTASYGPAVSASRAAGSEADRRAWLAFALDAVEATDAVARRWFRRDVEVRLKPDRSHVTAADTEIERLIRERIADRFPTHGMVGEEYGIEQGSGEARWYIDPIDGTANFVRGVPVFGTLLALEVGDELQIGVISMAAADERWWAGRGLGAWTARTGRLAGEPRRIAVSTIASLADAHLLYGELAELDGATAVPGFRAVVGDVWRTRNFGDCWMYGLLAEGAAEIVIEADLNTWDLAAPAIVVEEAGGRVTDLGGVRSIQRRSVLATNGVLHDVVLERFRSGG